MLTVLTTLISSSPSISIIFIIIVVIIVILIVIIAIIMIKYVIIRFTPELFFYYLLPPIILEAAYCLHNKHFFDNIRAILWSLDGDGDGDGDGLGGTILFQTIIFLSIRFAVVGTIVNFLLTGTLLVLIQVQKISVL